MTQLQESVWDYPRPPRLEPSAKRVRIVLGGATVADSTRVHRVLETSHPPVYYVPFADLAPGTLELSGGRGAERAGEGRGPRRWGPREKFNHSLSTQPQPVLVPQSRHV